MRRGSTNITRKPRSSSTPNRGIQYTPVDSMTTVLDPHTRSNQSARRYRSAVKASNSCTGCSERSAGTATKMAGGAHVNARRVQVQLGQSRRFFALLWRVLIIPSTIIV